MNTIYNGVITNQATVDYFHTLVNQVYKILPLKESNEPTLVEYMHGLQRELTGFSLLVSEVGADPIYITILSIIEYLISYNNIIDTPDVKREVFRCISLINKLEEKHGRNNVCQTN